MSRQSARDRALAESKTNFTSGQLAPGSDFETVILMLVDSARASVSLLGQEFLGRWSAAYAVMTLDNALLNPLVINTRIDVDLVKAWCMEQYLAIGFDCAMEEFL